MKAYKLLRKRKNQTLGPLFINKSQVIPIGQWLPAEAHRTKGYAFRPGWHTTTKPEAPHLSTKDRVWCEVEIENFQEIYRPKLQGGTWLIAQRMKVTKELK